jgi:hypothetical protein
MAVRGSIGRSYNLAPPFPDQPQARVITRSGALRLFVRARAFSTAPPPCLRRLGRMLVRIDYLRTGLCILHRRFKY